MKPIELFGKLNRLQQSRRFKMVVSIAVGVLAVLVFGAIVVSIWSRPAATELFGADAAPAEVQGTLSGASAEVRERAAAVVRGTVQGAPESRMQSLVVIAVVISVAAGAIIAAVWLGLGLTYLALAVGVSVIAVPLIWLDESNTLAGGAFANDPLEGWGQFGWSLLSMFALGAAFTALLQGARALLSVRGGTLAVARVVLTEAVRLKLSLALILALVVGLSLLPLVLNDDGPLRYQVQTFLKWGTGGTFMLAAVLTLVFGCATVAFEQRDKVIWQTMTKPISPLRYVVGKWLGLITLNAILLLTCGVGLFLYTENLRNQPAQGEVEPGVPAAGQAGDDGTTDDRRAINTQILVSREVVEPVPLVDVNSESVDEMVEQALALYAEENPGLRETGAVREQARRQLYTELSARVQYTIAPGERQSYEFSGLGQAAERGTQLTLHFKPEMGANDPNLQPPLWLVVYDDEEPYFIQRPAVALGVVAVETIPAEWVRDDGTLEVEVINGRLAQTEEGNIVVVPNTRDLAFNPVDGLRVSFAVSSYHLNFLRVMAVLWLKLAFLAMLAVALSTFLSFPVACFGSFFVFAVAEISGYLTDARDVIGWTDNFGNFSLVNAVTSSFSWGVSQLFGFYASLNPVDRLVDGVLLDWGDFAAGLGIVAVLTFVLLMFGVYMFRRRELAIYSGQ